MKWKPKVGESYWWISLTHNFVRRYENNKLGIDKIAIRMGNCFKTEKEALEKLKQIKAMLS